MPKPISENEFNFQGFRLWVNHAKAYGCAQFKYRGYEISMSNHGVDQGACPTRVAIFSKMGDIVGEEDSVQDAIYFVDTLLA